MKVDHLAVGINGPQQVTPLAANADVGLVHMPIDTSPAQMLLRAFSQFRSKFLDPSIHGGPIDADPALSKKIHDILIGQRVA